MEVSEDVPKVINISKKELVKIGYSSLEEWVEGPNNVYIGRRMPFVKGASQSVWANPYSAKKYGRDECIRMYDEHLYKNGELLDRLGELKGKTLGCWCKPEKCHGDILVEAVLNYIQVERELQEEEM